MPFTPNALLSMDRLAGEKPMISLDNLDNLLFVQWLGNSLPTKGKNLTVELPTKPEPIDAKL